MPSIEPKNLSWGATRRAQKIFAEDAMGAMDIIIQDIYGEHADDIPFDDAIDAAYDAFINGIERLSKKIEQRDPLPSPHSSSPKSEESP